VLSFGLDTLGMVAIAVFEKRKHGAKTILTE
jgi:hypothetical protein